MKFAQRMLDIACDTPALPLVRLIPFQHLIWTTDARQRESIPTVYSRTYSMPSVRVSTIMECQMQWLNDIWSLTSTFEVSIPLHSSRGRSDTDYTVGYCRTHAALHPHGTLQYHQDMVRDPAHFILNLAYGFALVTGKEYRYLQWRNMVLACADTQN